jgi:predicted small integral membrane protein
LEQLKVSMIKKGFIPLKTNWFDRLFIGVISYIALQLFWMRFLESLISINISIGIGIVWIIFVIWKG